MIQYPLWLADGGFKTVIEKNKQITIQKKLMQI